MTLMDTQGCGRIKTVDMSTSSFVNGATQYLSTPLWHPQQFLKVDAQANGKNLNLRSALTCLETYGPNE